MKLLLWKAYFLGLDKAAIEELAALCHRKGILNKKISFLIDDLCAAISCEEPIEVENRFEIAINDTERELIYVENKIAKIYSRV